MKIAFTICSNNYLAQASTLGDSLKRNNPDLQFVIFLCDNFDNIKIEIRHKVVEIQSLGIKKFDQMVRMYNIVELNTSVKPFVFKYIFEKFEEYNYVMYFDPDICVYSNIDTVIDELGGENSILLTPHIYKPIEYDSYNPDENLFAKYGIYNLGFIAVRRSVDANKMLDWWMNRLENNCYINPKKGIFVDQLPMNYAPIFFENVKISENMGLNVAPWNLHERQIAIIDSKIFINNDYELIFYHFSGCDFENNEVISNFYNRVNLRDNLVLKDLYKNYIKDVNNNNYDYLSKIQCCYTNKKKKTVNKSDFINIIFKKYLNAILGKN